MCAKYKIQLGHIARTRVLYVCVLKLNCNLKSICFIHGTRDDWIGVKNYSSLEEMSYIRLYAGPTMKSTKPYTKNRSKLLLSLSNWFASSFLCVCVYCVCALKWHGEIKFKWQILVAMVYATDFPFFPQCTHFCRTDSQRCAVENGKKSLALVSLHCNVNSYKIYAYFWYATNISCFVWIVEWQWTLHDEATIFFM